MTHILAGLILSAAGAADLSPAPADYHPHFSKKVQVSLRGGFELSVSHLTVTFDKKGAEEMEPGKAWHLANAHFETTKDLKLGGLDVKAGRHAIKARKTKKGWELVLDKPGNFDRTVSDSARVLAATFDAKAPLFEHLSIDLQPSGDKSNTKLNLDIRFDTYLARCEIVLP